MKRKNNLAEFYPVSEEEFSRVSDLIKLRCKLIDVNQVYETLFHHFKKGSKPLSVPAMVKMGIKITGQTGEARLATLRALDLISITKKGVMLHK